MEDQWVFRACDVGQLPILDLKVNRGLFEVQGHGSLKLWLLIDNNVIQSDVELMMLVTAFLGLQYDIRGLLKVDLMKVEPIDV